MTYFKAYNATDMELHTIGSLLCVLDEVTSEHLGDDQRAMASGIINLTRIVAERITKAQELHDAELKAHRANSAAETPIAAMHREIVRRQVFLNGDHGLTDEEFTAYNMATVEMANAIVDLPAQNADDMLRKILGYSINGDHPDLHGTEQASRIWAEMQAMLTPAMSA